MWSSLKRHWPEYLMEACCLGFFMVIACVVGLLLAHPSSPLNIADPVARRIVAGTAMGLTAITIIYSPWGKQSGAHINPAVTLTFLRLRKIAPVDAFFYISAQFTGAAAGVLLVVAAIGDPVGHPMVNYAATMPGKSGIAAAFLAEAAISFILMSMVLRVSNSQKLARYTGIFAGILVATYITIEEPLSGMSMNPARSLGSAFPASLWNGIWIYFTAPPFGMLLAAEWYLRSKGLKKVFCAKYHHHNDKRCIFRCNYDELIAQ